MSIQAISKSFELQDGRTITIETGKLAKQADGAVIGRKLLDYLKQKDILRYRQIIKDLGLRK